MSESPKYIGDFAACEAWAARLLTCSRCNVCWTGCWDNFQCPTCGEGDVPTNDAINCALFEDWAIQTDRQFREALPGGRIGNCAHIG
jgi:hypothetical protein